MPHKSPINIYVRWCNNSVMIVVIVFCNQVSQYDIFCLSFKLRNVRCFRTFLVFPHCFSISALFWPFYLKCSCNSNFHLKWKSFNLHWNWTPDLEYLSIPIATHWMLFYQQTPDIEKNPKLGAQNTIFDLFKWCVVVVYKIHLYF